MRPMTVSEAVVESGSALPWAAFLLLTLAFFIALHDPTRSRSIQDDYLPDESTLQKNASEGNTKRQVGFLMAGAFGLLVLASPLRRKVQMNGFFSLLVVFFLAWLMLSVVWADDRAITFRRLIVIGMLCLGALAVAVRMSPREIVLFVFFSSMVYLLAGIASEVALGTFSPALERYRFAGTIHPNNQGVNCSLLLLAALAAAHTEKRWRYFFLASSLLPFVFLVLTKSRTSLGSFLITLALYLALVYGRSRAFLFCCSLGITLGLAVLLVGQESFMPMVEEAVLLGRTDQDIGGAMNLTGRLPLWQTLLEYSAERPLQGYGYGSFFTVKHIQEISAKQGWPIAECHSVFLEVLLGIGLVGLVSYCLIQILGVSRSLSYFRHTGDVSYAFLTGLLLLGIVGGIAESTLLVPTMQTFVQFITIAALAFQAPPEAVRKHLLRLKLPMLVSRYPLEVRNV